MLCWYSNPWHTTLPIGVSCLSKANWWSTKYPGLKRTSRKWTKEGPLSEPEGSKKNRKERHMFWGSRMAENALHCTAFLTYSKVITSSPLVTELPVGVVLFCCHTPPLNTTLCLQPCNHMTDQLAAPRENYFILLQKFNAALTYSASVWALQQKSVAETWIRRFFCLC